MACTTGSTASDTWFWEFVCLQCGVWSKNGLLFFKLSWRKERGWGIMGYQFLGMPRSFGECFAIFLEYPWIIHRLYHPPSVQYYCQRKTLFILSFAWAWWFMHP
jgi:hypothetical protein